MNTINTNPQTSAYAGRGNKSAIPLLKQLFHTGRVPGLYLPMRLLGLALFVMLLPFTGSSQTCYDFIGPEVSDNSCGGVYGGGQLAKIDENFDDGEDGIVVLKVLGDACCGTVYVNPKAGTSCYREPISGPVGTGIWVGSIAKQQVDISDPNDPCIPSGLNICLGGQNVVETFCSSGGVESRISFLGWKDELINGNPTGYTLWYYYYDSKVSGCGSSISHITFEYDNNQACCPTDCMVSGPESVECPGSTLQYTASFDASLCTSVSYSWTASLGGNTVATGSASTFDFTPAACGTYDISVDISCDNCLPLTCGKTLVVTAPPVSLTCPGDELIPACQGQSEVNAAFEDWLAEVQWGGGCGATIDNGAPTAPSFCGGTTTVTWTVTSDCEAPVTCSADFTVTDAPPVSLSCPGDASVDACQSQTVINNAFDVWLQTVSYSGGCGAEINNDNTGAPDVCTGGTATVNFTVTSDCEPPVTCSSSFTVPACEVPCSIVPDQSCNGLCANDLDGASYMWSGPDGFSSSERCTGPLTSEGWYTVTITNAIGCTSTCSQYVEEQCETAWGRDGASTDPQGTTSVCHDDLDDLGYCPPGNQQWGFSTPITPGESRILQLLAGAPGYCGNGGLGETVGYAEVDWTGNGDAPVITVNTIGEWSLSEIHVWMGCSPLPFSKNGKCTNSPGQLGCTYEFNDNPVSYVIDDCTAGLPCDGGKWIALHVVPCRINTCSSSGNLSADIPDPAQNIIVDQDRNLRVVAFPNPTSDDIQLNIDGLKEGEFEIQLFDQFGRMVKQVTSSTDLMDGNQVRIEVTDDLSDGLYYINVQNQGSRVSTKVMIVRR